MFGYGQFNKMKRIAYFINKAGGGCMNQVGLVRALKVPLFAGPGVDDTVGKSANEDG
jgi:lactate dehydrogenase-like 2-hydroxyacid dehydrogenase